MLKTRFCTVLGCRDELKIFDEVATGICSEHISLFTNSKYFVGMCWYCDSITGAYEIPRRLDGILKEKYLFSKGCSNCSSVNDETSWITIKNLTADHYWAVDESGKIHRINEENSTIPT